MCNSLPWAHRLDRLHNAYNTDFADQLHYAYVDSWLQDASESSTVKMA